MTILEELKYVGHFGRRYHLTSRRAEQYRIRLQRILDTVGQSLLSGTMGSN